MTTSAWRVFKDEAVGDEGMVAGKHPLAVRAGLDALRRGGNAVDAAVTMAFTLAVVEPQSSGLGGGGFVVIHEARSGREVAIDYAMDAPLAAGPDAYELDEGVGASSYGWRKVKGEANVLGYRAASVPGMVRGLALALERHGTISLAEALAPAIRCAEEGAEVLWQVALRIAMSMRDLARFPASAAVFLPGGFPPRPWGNATPADRLVQPDLARTLRLIAVEGPDAFYAGEIARAIARAMREHDGLITEEDLARYRPTVTEGGLATDYRGHRIVGVPGACGSVTLQQGLAILEGYDLAALGHGSVAATHLQAEAFRLAFADRYRYVADPKQVAVPWAGLLSPDYAAERRALIDPARAAATVEAGDPWRFDGGAPAPAGAAVREGSPPSSTTTLAIVDRDRNVVSLTQTLVNAFGCGVVVPGTGVLLNNAMSWFDPRPGQPNSAAPGKRGLNNMAPLIVLRDGLPLLATGAVGGRKIIQAVAQVVSNVLDFGLGMQDAVGAPRIDCSGPAVLVDARDPPSLPAALAALGHTVEVREESFHAYHFATPVGIAIDPATGRLHSGVDPFRLSEAAGY
ncbi:MAG TPA: gamma-glutamyltransferase [Thermomicrobiales bacterium]|nr:gamma-glutamyltransferase [Thermomicrobiales bacterium]